ncbi:MAG: hypothetical protein NTU61_05415 [Candidatus Altiarchaeota archaeon]|nr:hypothetical protein [Candidatus Altiarchaeota archaeon]
MVAVSGCVQCFNPGGGEEATTTTVEKLVCNAPYIRVGKVCCLDQNANAICDSDEVVETTQTTQAVAQTTITVKQTHKACENGACVEKDGVGVDQCQTSGECKRMKCNAGYCVQANEQGQDECAIDNQCRHKVCNATHYCVEVMSKGSSECQTTIECVANTPKHKACGSVGGILKCILVDGAGADECRDDMSCYQVTNGVCLNGACVAGGVGNDSCTLNRECYHFDCLSSKCVRVNSTGESECQGTSDQTCWIKDQMKEYHLECVNGTCAKVDGAGDNQCDYVGLTTVCRHKVCQTGLCVELLTPGKSTCTTKQDCSGPTHHICDGTTCIEVSGAGPDECTTNGQCM